jgi:hypothetical protein
MLRPKSLSRLARRLQSQTNNLRVYKPRPVSEDGHASETATSVPGLSTVAEEDWSDFEEVSMVDVVEEEPKDASADTEGDEITNTPQPPPAAALDLPAPSSSAAEVLMDPFATPSDYWRRSPASSLRPGSVNSSVNVVNPQVSRIRQLSKASRQSRRSSTGQHGSTLGADLRLLLLDFPTPPSQFYRSLLCFIS